MNPKRPVTLIIATIVLIVLVLFSSGLTLASNFGLLGSTFGADGLAGRRFMPGSGSGNLPGDGFNNLQPGTRPDFGNGQPLDNSGSNGGTSQTNPNYQNFQGRTGGINTLSRIIRIATIGLYSAVLILGLLAAFGLWKQKKWAAILAIILSALILLLSIPDLLRIFSWLILGETFLKVLLSLAVIILLLLPASRRAYSPAPALDLDDDI